MVKDVRDGQLAVYKPFVMLDPGQLTVVGPLVAAVAEAAKLGILIQIMKDAGLAALELFIPQDLQCRITPFVGGGFELVFVGQNGKTMIQYYPTEFQRDLETMIDSVPMRRFRQMTRGRLFCFDDIIRGERAQDYTAILANGLGLRFTGFNFDGRYWRADPPSPSVAVWEKIGGAIARVSRLGYVLEDEGVVKREPTERRVTRTKTDSCEASRIRERAGLSN